MNSQVYDYNQFQGRSQDQNNINNVLFGSNRDPSRRVIPTVLNPEPVVEVKEREEKVREPFSQIVEQLIGVVEQKAVEPVMRVAQIATVKVIKPPILINPIPVEKTVHIPQHAFSGIPFVLGENKEHVINIDDNHHQVIQRMINRPLVGVVTQIRDEWSLGPNSVEIREPVQRRGCTHDFDGRCAICFNDEEKEHLLNNSDVGIISRLSSSLRSVDTNPLSDDNPSCGGGGQSDDSDDESDGSEDPFPPDDEGPIHEGNNRGHFMFDNYVNRKLVSESRLFLVPQAVFHGVVSQNIISKTTLVQDYGAYYDTKDISVLMPVSIVNELKAFWTNEIRDPETYKKCVFKCRDLLRNADMHSKMYRETILYAPLLSFWQTAVEDKGTQAIVENKLWSWNYCVIFIIVLALWDKLEFGRSFNVFLVSFLILAFVAIRFGVSKNIEVEFLRFCRLKFGLAVLFGAIHLTYYLLFNAYFNNDFEQFNGYLSIPSTSNSTIVWTETSFSYYKFAIYEGPSYMPYCITTVLLIIFYRMNQLYSVSFIIAGVHNNNNNVAVNGFRQVRSILPLSVAFAFIQIVLFYLYAPYWVGFGLYIFMKAFNRYFSALPIAHNYRPVFIDVQFY